jgi:hypothetical protein
VLNLVSTWPADADALSDAAGVGVTVAVSDEEFLEITAIARIKIPTTTAITIPLDEPALLLLLV